MVEKLRDMFTRFDAIHERDRQANIRTSLDGIDRAYCIVSRGKTGLSCHH